LLTIYTILELCVMMPVSNAYAMNVCRWM